MHTILKVIEMVVSVLLIVAIMVQNRSSGLSSTFGGGAPIATSKRGAEKIVFVATIVLAVLFVLLSLASLFVK
ncbi:preprotein translocase subunit SecG [Candidatus Gracilibacteria bacterium]|nr:preprotein translocase subunit SecG [Candidatus Gracilibacteria bacterium]